MKPEARIFVAGHRGMVGTATVRALRDRGFEHLLLRTRQEVDLCDSASVDQFFSSEKPDVVVHCAARVGGIHANRSFPAEFMYENLSVAQNVIHSAWRHGCKRLLFLGSSCIYPREVPQPIPEEALLTGPLEPTNEAYALAKIAGLEMCRHYRHQYGVCFHSAMPTNLYGPGDTYHPDHSHVIPGLLRRFHQAKLEGSDAVTLWGTGTPQREFLHVEDLAAGLLTLLETENPPDIANIGFGEDLPIRELAGLIAETVGYEGRIETDPSMPDGTPRKLLDISRMQALGWSPQISLRDGLRQTYAECLQNRRFEK